MVDVRWWRWMSRAGLVALGLGTGALAGAAGCIANAFACTDDAQCRSMAGNGRCEGSGHCSFPDLDCPLGYRYGEHSGDWSGACVEPEPDPSGESGPESPLSDGDGSIDGGSDRPDGDDAADGEGGGLDGGDPSTTGSDEPPTEPPTDDESGGTTGPATPVEGARILVIEQRSDASPGDAAVAARLVAAGHDVTEIDQDDADPAAAEEFDLVLISSTVSSGGLSNKFRNVPVPIVLWEHALYDDMGMSNGGDGDASATALEIVDPDHPLAAGLSGTVDVFETAASIRFGVPVGQAKSIARTTGAPPRTAYFAYDEGDAMQGLDAPARRVGLFLGDESAEALTPAGWALFDAAVAWALD